MTTKQIDSVPALLGVMAKITSGATLLIAGGAALDDNEPAYASLLCPEGMTETIPGNRCTDQQGTVWDLTDRKHYSSICPVGWQRGARYTGQCVSPSGQRVSQARLTGERG